MKDIRKERRQWLNEMIEALENDRPIKEVLLAISRGEKVTADEKKRAINYERNKRNK